MPPVIVSLTPAGNAPVLKQKKFAVVRDRNVGWMMQWLRKQLKCEPADSVVSLVSSHTALPWLESCDIPVC